MLTSVQAYNAGVTPLSLAIGEDGENPFKITDIQGLGPVKAEVTTTPFGSLDGDSLSGTSVGKRNIVMSVALDPDWSTQSVGDLRTLLYAYFMPKQKVRLHFFSTHLPEVTIEGYVESCEPDMFSREPAMTISVICPKPAFMSADTEQLIDVTSQTYVPITINNPGTVSSGFVIWITSSAARPTYTGDLDIVVQNPIDLSEQVLAAHDLTINAGNRLELSTIHGDKYFRTVTVPGGDITNQIYLLDEGSAWPQLLPGENTVFFYAEDGGGQTAHLMYLPYYGGL